MNQDAVPSPSTHYDTAIAGLFLENVRGEEVRGEVWWARKARVGKGVARREGKAGMGNCGGAGGGSGSSRSS